MVSKLRPNALRLAVRRQRELQANPHRSQVDDRSIKGLLATALGVLRGPSAAPSLHLKEWPGVFLIPAATESVMRRP
jgi:hypothetical protein